MKTKNCLRIFDKKVILTHEFLIKKVDEKFYLTQFDKIIHEIQPNTKDDPQVLVLEPLGKNYSQVIFFN